MSPINKPAALAFLDFIEPTIDDPTFAFQVFDDDKGRNDKSLGRTYIGTFNDQVKTLAAANRDKCGVYVTVNDTDGKRRRAENVTRVRKHFVEVDGDLTLDEIKSIAAARYLELAWVNESSPGKYHVYFNVADDVSADLAGFTLRQKKLAAAFKGGKESVDLSRVLRVPGFWHHKGEPFQVRSIKELEKPDARAHGMIDFDIALSDIEIEAPPDATADDVAHEEDQTAIDRAIEHFKTFPEAISDTPNGKHNKKGNNQTYDAMCRARDFGIEEQTCFDLADTYYNARCNPRWSLEELQTLVHNAYKYAKGTQGADHPLNEARRDFGNAADIPADDEIKAAAAPHPSVTPEAMAKWETWADAERKAKRKAKDDEQKQEQSGEDIGAESKRRLEVIKASDVEPQNIDWLWKDHLAAAQHTTSAGVQGDGKSQVAYSMVAAITTGGTWPGSNEKAPLGDCIILSAEDTDRDVLVPRLAAAGADLNRVHIIKASVDERGKRSKVLLQNDIKLIEATVKKIGNVKLITIDPISSYLGGDIDSHNNTELRAALDPITAMAESTGAAVFSITHFNKATRGVSAMNRIMGSVAFTAAPRAAFVVLRDRDDDNKRLFLPVKANLMKENSAYGMSFQIEEVDSGLKDKRDKTPIFAPRVKWLERVGMSADEVLARQDGDGTSTLGAVMIWLRDRLTFGPELVTVLHKEVNDRDEFSWGTVRNAQRKLGVESRKRAQADGHGPYEWLLPEPDLSATAPDGYTGAKSGSEEELTV